MCVHIKFTPKSSKSCDGILFQQPLHASKKFYRNFVEVKFFFSLTDTTEVGRKDNYHKKF